MKQRFECDPEKSKHNKEKHGLDLIEAQELWNVAHVLFPAREVNGEPRQIIVGEIRERNYIAIFAQRDYVIRLISCHRDDARWKNAYEEARHEKKDY